ASSVKVKILGTDDPYLRWLGIGVNKPLDKNWWETKNYTCNYLVDRWDVGKEFECNFTGSFSFAEASVSSDANYTWNISITYPNGNSFQCVVDRRLRCPTKSIPLYQYVILIASIAICIVVVFLIFKKLKKS
ncbi:MAG: hypothetical protein QXR09_01335, partial [Candidatus Aenigmatarchaeota archaeon]